MFYLKNMVWIPRNKQVDRLDSGDQTTRSPRMPQTDNGDALLKGHEI